jgi:DNA-binding NarL/FixJ family response regulator
MYTNSTVSVIIIDDHPVVLEGFTSLLRNIEGIGITGCFTSAGEGLAHLAKYPVDILLLDINLPDRNGIELCALIRKQHPATRIIIISNHSERGMITRLLQEGAAGYLLKNASAAELSSASATPWPASSCSARTYRRSSHASLIASRPTASPPHPPGKGDPEADRSR